MPASSDALVLFDIDGTLIRRAGPHHREALVDAIRRTAGVETTTEGVPVAGMLDRDILATMMLRAGMTPGAIRKAMPAVVERAQRSTCARAPDLGRKVCPGVRRTLGRLERRGAVIGLVTGNLSRIGWKKMERAGLRPYFRFGAFAELAKDRAGSGAVRDPPRQAQRWIGRECSISLIGDHPNDIRAARANGIRAIAVATGLASMEELRPTRRIVILPDLRSSASWRCCSDGSPVAGGKARRGGVPQFRVSGPARARHCALRRAEHAARRGDPESSWNLSATMTPFLEIGSNVGHTSYMLANEFGASGFALDLSADSLRYGAR